MFETVFEKFSGILDQRFILSVWVPCLFFWLALWCLVVGWAGPSVVLGWWQLQPTELQLALVVLLLAWITFFARLLLSALDSIIRIYEGYWNVERVRFLRNFKERRRQYYIKKIAELKLAGKNLEIQLRFPPATRPEAAMPTRLGNLLKNAEMYPNLRYGIDAVVIWPRLYNVLPDNVVKNFGAAATELELMLVISVLGAAFVLFGGFLAALLLPLYAVPVCTFGGALVAWMGYQGALRSALPYNRLIKAAFDIHRGTLLKTIGWTPADSYDKEKIQWDSISKLWHHGAPPGGPWKGAYGYKAEKAQAGATQEDSFGYLWIKNTGEAVEGACLLGPVSGPEKAEE
jgi:hypothetical protein